MTRKEAVRQTHQENTLMALGFTADEAAALRRISMTLHRWAEHECNGNIERDGENSDGAPYWSNPNTGRPSWSPCTPRYWWRGRVGSGRLRLPSAWMVCRGI